MPKLAPAAAALALLAAAAGAQLPDSTAEAGRRDGHLEASARGVGGYAAFGVLTGFVAGAIGVPMVAIGDPPIKVLGVGAILPVFWTVTAAGNRASPPPELERRIAPRPEAYQLGFRAAYAERLAQRRQRAALIGGVAGGATGLAAFVALVVAALSALDY